MSCCDQVYLCGGEEECPVHGGFDTCCDRPDLHMPIQLRTFGGEPSTPHHHHVGWPVDVEDILRRVRSGRTYYWPTDPVTIDQRAYRDFAATRPPNSE